jgi:hypothetical protein
MSDARAIEGVTATLLQVIDDAVNSGPGAFPGGVKVVAKPPHEVQTDVDQLQFNLFLYRTEVAAGLRNEDPLDLTPGESANPPLPLVLHYLMTPYVQSGKDLDAHRLLGLAARAFNEHAVLGRTELTDSSGAFSDVATQLDRIRITWVALAESDIYSLWSAFQTPYRLSAALEVRPVLIDGTQPPNAPLPVIRRGDDDRGPVAEAQPGSPYPELSSAAPPNSQTAARPGESVHLLGINLVAQTVTAVLTHPLLVDAVPLPAADVTDTDVRIDLPAGAGAPQAGLWSVTLQLTNTVAGTDVTAFTNAVPLSIAPRITSAMPMNVALDPQGAAQIALTCEPAVLAGQPVFLVIGSRAVAENRAATGTPVTGSALAFAAEHQQPGSYVMRLRVGGVDSLVVDRSQVPPVFDATQSVTVTP